MAFPPGNQYGVARRTVENELRKVVHRRPERLRSALERVLEDACDSPSDSHHMACISFIADRLDGRARQAVDITTTTDARALDLSQVVQAVLAARASGATDAQFVDANLSDSENGVASENHSHPALVESAETPHP